jgi:hypothetical protein
MMGINNRQIAQGGSPKGRNTIPDYLYNQVKRNISQQVVQNKDEFITPYAAKLGADSLGLVEFWNGVKRSWIQPDSTVGMSLLANPSSPRLKSLLSNQKLNLKNATQVFVTEPKQKALQSINVISDSRTANDLESTPDIIPEYQGFMEGKTVPMSGKKINRGRGFGLGGVTPNVPTDLLIRQYQRKTQREFTPVNFCAPSNRPYTRKREPSGKSPYDKVGQYQEPTNIQSQPTAQGYTVADVSNINTHFMKYFPSKYANKVRKVVCHSTSAGKSSPHDVVVRSMYYSMNSLASGYGKLKFFKIRPEGGKYGN